MTTDQFPPPNFVPVSSAVAGIEVYAPAPPPEEEHRELVQFACPRCGATTAYSAGDGGLTCANCDYYEPVQKAMVGKGVEQFEFTPENMERAAYGWGEARTELQCQGCGAYTTVARQELSVTCPFCGSNKVLQREAPQDILRPRCLIPFKIETPACHEAVREWLGSSWMTPSGLRRMARVADFRGVYLPFWTFDANTHASWQAEVAHTETERYYEDGEWRTRTKTVWKWESGHVDMKHEDILEAGTGRLSAKLLGELKDYNFQKLVAYEPRYLAGFQAQAYDIPLETAWETGRHQMRELTRETCRGQASNSQMRNFSMELDFEREFWRYVLLPVYIAVYSYDHKSYQVMVNGQTAGVTGQRPVAWTKVWVAVGGLMAPGLLLGLLGIIGLLLGPVGFMLLILGFIFLIIGLVISFMIITQAQAMDDV